MMFRVAICVAFSFYSWLSAHPTFAQPTSQKAKTKNTPTTQKTKHKKHVVKNRTNHIHTVQRHTQQTKLPPVGKKHKTPHFRTFQTLQDAIKEAQKRKKPIFLDLFATWCGPCKRLEHQTFSHPLIYPLLNKYLVVRFDIDQPEGRQLIRKFRVGRFPTTLILDQNGKEIERIIGYYTARFFRPAVVAGLLGKGTYLDLFKQIQKQPTNLKLQLQLADRAVLRRQVDVARRIYQTLRKLDPKNKKGVGAWAVFGIARSYVRVGMYAYAIPWLEHFHKQYPQRTPAQIEAYRLHIYTLGRMKEKLQKAQLVRQFKKMFKGKNPLFK